MWAGGSRGRGGESRVVFERIHFVSLGKLADDFSGDLQSIVSGDMMCGIPFCSFTLTR